jgi:deoxyribonuclease-4
MSIGGGLHRAVERAEQVEATALQVFVKSSRQWSAKPLTRSEVAAFREGTEAHGLTPYTLAHGTYLINLASPDDDLWRKSLKAFRLEVDRCARLGIPYLVVHPGAHVGAGERAGMTRVARALRRALRDRKATSATPAGDGVTVLLENTAGQGTNLGNRFEQLAWMIERSGVEDRLGVCFDTCHALAAGYDIRTARAFRATVAEFDRTVGLERLKAFHLNDSKFGPGSRRDRHEHIGKGRVGLEAFRLILNDRRFRGLPMVLETPKGEDLAEDRENLSVLRSLVGRKRP